MAVGTQFRSFVRPPTEQAKEKEDFFGVEVGGLRSERLAGASNTEAIRAFRTSCVEVEGGGFTETEGRRLFAFCG